MKTYHLTTLDSGRFSVGASSEAPGEHPATELTAYHYVAPAEYCDEWLRRMAFVYGAPASDEGLKAAIEAHRRGGPLPPEEWAQRPAWAPPMRVGPAYEALPRRRA